MNRYQGSTKTRQWQISAEGFTIGPHDEEYVIEVIEAGRLTTGHVRPVGELRWMALADHPPFADALKWAGPTVAERPSLKTKVPAPRSGKHATQAPTMWQISAPGVPVGPHTEEDVIEMIEGGLLFEGQVRHHGELGWMDLQEHPPFEEARLRASTRAFSRS